MMPRRAIRRTAVALALATAALLAPSPGHALPGTLFERAAAATLSPLLHHLQHLFGISPAPKSGASLDPDGATADSGSSLDPDGATTAGDSGSKLDPDGRF